MSWRSRGNSPGTGRERPRVQSPRGGRYRTTRHGRGTCGRHLPTGDLPAHHAPPAADLRVPAAIVEVAEQNATDGARMVAAIASRELAKPLNRKRVQHVIRAHKLLQPTRGAERRRRLGYFRVTHPDELWHIDMTKVWTAQHG